MKTGKSLQELAAEIMRQSETKRDFIADTASMRMTGEAALALEDKGDVKWAGDVNDLAHGQIAAHTGIPKQYYDKMRKDAPALLSNNVNEWFKRYPAPRMVRTLDDRVRGFLSNSFRPLENIDLAGAVLPVLQKRNLEVMSCELTERRIYIKAVDTQLFRDVPVGYKMGDGSHRIFDTCAPAIIISNSEVGYGRLVVETGVFTKACTNMALFTDGGMKRTHVGARHKLIESVENIDHLLTDRTKEKTDEALWLQVRDVIASAFDPEKLTVRVDRLTAAAENRIEGKVEKVVELAANRFALNEGERESVLKHLIAGGSLSQYGLHAAVTRSAQDAADYDRATDLEYIGGKIIELPKTEWAELARAA